MASIVHQRVTACRGSRIEHLQLPAPDAEAVPGVRWGRFEDFFTPAFWVARDWIDSNSGALVNYTIGTSLREEVAACLLGGHGMSAEVGLAAFQKLRSQGLLDGKRSQAEIEKALVEPLMIFGRAVKYRFPKTKARFVSLAMQRLNAESPPMASARELRDWLLTFSGIGPKTASWVVRNSLHSDEIAILDVHIVRAGLLMRLFRPADSVQRDYFGMETRLMDFAKAIGMRLSRFDSMVWSYMRGLSRVALQSLAETGG